MCLTCLSNCANRFNNITTLLSPLSQGYYVVVLRIPVEIPVSRKVYKCVYTQSKKCVYR
jgi:hypothetical protein